MTSGLAKHAREDNEFFWPVLSILVCLIVMFQLLFAIYLIKSDKSEFIEDAAVYYHQSLFIANYFTNNQFNDTSFYATFLQHYPLTKPPFFMMSTLPLYWAFGISSDSARLTNIFYYILLVFGIYMLGRKIHSEKAGILSSLFICLIPAVVFQVGGYMPDLALITLVVVTILIFELSELLDKVFFVYLLGISFAIGMLIRWDFPLFVLPWIGCSLIINYKKISTLRLNHILASALLSTLLFVPWYLINIDYIVKIIVNQQPDAYFPSFFTYFGLNNAMLGEINQLILITMFSFFIIFHKDKYKMHLALSVFIPFLIMSFLSNKRDRYFLTIVPFLIIILSISLISLKKTYLKNIVIIISVTAFSMFFLSVLNHPEDYKITQIEYLLIKPNLDFEYGKLINMLKKTNLSGTVLFLDCHPRIYATTLNYLFYSDLKEMTPIVLSSQLNQSEYQNHSYYAKLVKFDEIYQEIPLIIVFTKHYNPLFKNIYEQLNISYTPEMTIKSNYLKEDYIIYTPKTQIQDMKENETNDWVS